MEDYLQKILRARVYDIAVETPLELAKNLTRSAICGVTKNQLLRNFKEAYELDDGEIDKILQICNFNEEPKKINYEY